MELLLQGLILGSTIGIVSIGYALIYSILRLINFAHGELLMTGAYLCFFIHNTLNIPILFSAIIAILLNGCLGVIIYLIAYKPLREYNRLMMLVSSLGVSIILQSILIILFGTEPKSLNLEKIEILSTKFFYGEILSMIIIFSLIIYIPIFYRKTKIGLAMKAIYTNQTQASLYGLPINKITIITFFASSSLAGIAGISIAINKHLIPTLGFEYAIWAFAATVIAGFNNLKGVVLTSMSMGLIMVILMKQLDHTQFITAIIFGLMLIILFLKPNGIFGYKKRNV